jgi:penicillin-binding protein 2
MRGAARPIAAAVIGLTLAAACSAPAPDPTASPTAVPTPPLSAADDTVRAFLAAWRIRTYEPMYEMLAAADRQQLSRGEFVGLLQSFEDLTGVKRMRSAVGSTIRTTLPPQARPPDQPAPTPTALPAADPSVQPPALPPTASPEPTPASTPVALDTPLDGPVPAVRVPVELHFGTDLFGDVDLNRQIILVQGADGWQIRWSAEVLFPELAEGWQLALTRQDSPRGRIESVDGTVFAQTRDDGVRVYPQEWLAGQTIGWVSDVTADELKTLTAQGYRAGDVIGRGGLEQGADVLLRGEPGFTLSAVPPAGDDGVPLLERPMVPGSDVVITIRPRIQAIADAAIGGYAEAGTAVIDPATGDVWALASAPLFNPNAMTLGTTLTGQSLAAPSASARLNHATMGAYPTGSSFKVFTLGAALKAGVASAATRMTCHGTWTFSGFTFRNYLEHQLPGFVSLLQAMAFSCNTTYMPLSIMVYDADTNALTDVVREFGFGQLSGIQHLPEVSGILPDRQYFEVTKRGNGAYSPYGPFDQIQLAIGQGSLLATPLQMANAYAAFGNGGVLWVPRIVVEARPPGGEPSPVAPKRARQISLSGQQLDYVVESMKAVVNLPYGTARAAFAGFGIQVAGKSGTAETGGPNPNAWFPAIAPADDPQISIATVLVRVRLATGGSDAAPLVRRVMARYFADR